jgi:anti-anti-sigma regulatory factor
MSMHFISRPWQVQGTDDGINVKLSDQDLDDTVTDDLLELVRESGRPNLQLDLLEVRALPAAVAGKLFALDQRLRGTGGRLVLSNLAPELCEVLQAPKE